MRRIRASTNIPLSVDIERGYSNDPGISVRHIQSIIDTGAVGINLEDNQGQDVFLKKLEALSNYLHKTNQRLFINARTDVLLQKLPDPLETVITRATLYRDAGANGLFVTAIQDTEQITEIVSSVALLVNVVGVSSIASVSVLADCGVKRISMAGILYSAGYKKIDSLVGRIRAENSLNALS